MAHFDYLEKSILIKIMYYGPGLSGKSTNLRYILYEPEPYMFFSLDSSRAFGICCYEPDSIGDFIYRILPIKHGAIGPFETKFLLMEVHGQVYYNHKRKPFLQGVDGIIFVCDSQTSCMDANLCSLSEMQNNLEELNVNPEILPIVFQYNKRDLEEITPLAALNNSLNPKGKPYIEASAISGCGVKESLEIMKKMLYPRYAALLGY